MINKASLTQDVFLSTYVVYTRASQGPDPMMGGDEPPRLFGKELTEAERRELLVKAYNHVKESLERFRRPDGKKDAPARTCRDLHVAHPELPSGRCNIQRSVPHLPALLPLSDCNPDG